MESTANDQDDFVDVETPHLQFSESDPVVSTNPADAEMNNLLNDPNFQPPEVDYDSIGEFCFESDALALKGNVDYKNLLEAIVVLEAQRAKAVKDLEMLLKQKEEALANPFEFVERLRRKENMFFPAPQKIHPIPVIDWSKYALSGNPSAFSRRQMHEQRQMTYNFSRNKLKSANVNQPWSAKEEKRLKELLIEFPPDPDEDEASRWEKVAECLENRTPIEVATRGHMYTLTLTEGEAASPSGMSSLIKQSLSEETRNDMMGSHTQLTNAREYAMEDKVESSVMSSPAFPRMSLVAQYDDLCRYTKVLTLGCEEEFQIFVESQKSAFNRLKNVEYEIEGVKARNAILEAEKEEQDFQINQMKHLIEDEIKRKRKTEEDKNCMQRQLALIKDVLLENGNTIDNQMKEKLFGLSSTACKQTAESTSRLPTIEEPTISFISESDMDNTVHDAVLVTPHQPKRHSRGSGKRSGDCQRRKRKCEERIQFFSPTEGHKRDIFPKQREFNSHSSSEENFFSPEKSCPILQPPQSDSEHTEVSLPTDIKKALSPRSALTECTAENRMHTFEPKRITWPAVPCSVCREHFKFFESVLICRNCESLCHTVCKEQCVLPCAPNTNVISARNNDVNSPEIQTQEIEPVPAPSILGPFHAVSVRPKNFQVGPLKPRKHRRKSKGVKQTYFESPLIQ